MSRATTDQVVINEKIFIVNKWPLEPKWLSQKLSFLNISVDHWQHLMASPSYRRFTPTYFSNQTRKVSRIGLFIYSCYLHKIYGISILPNKFVNSLNCMIVSYTICGVLQSITIFGILFRCFLYKLNFYHTNPFFYICIWWWAFDYLLQQITISK